MRRASQNPRAPRIAHPATGPITAPAIHALLSFFSPPFALLAVVVAAAVVDVAEEPGVAVVVVWESRNRVSEGSSTHAK